MGAKAIKLGSLFLCYNVPHFSFCYHHLIIQGGGGGGVGADYNEGG